MPRPTTVPGEPSVSLLLRLPHRHVEALRAVAAQLGRTPSQLIAEIVDQTQISDIAEAGGDEVREALRAAIAAAEARPPEKVAAAGRAHPAWKVNLTGINVCVDCGEPKRGPRGLGHPCSGKKEST